MYTFAHGIISIGWIVLLNVSLVSIFVFRKFIGLCLQTLPRDIRAVYRLGKIELVLFGAKLQNLSVGKRFDSTAKKHPHKVCFIFEGQKWTFEDVRKLSNKVGNYFSSQGFRKGDRVALMMENCPEFVCLWLGLSKIGASVPLLNIHLRQTALMHSITVIGSKAVIFGNDLSSAIETLEHDDETIKKIQWFSWGETQLELLEEIKNLKSCISQESESCPIPEAKIASSDDLLYIYTSGTTGLPKPARYNHSRFNMGAVIYSIYNGIRRSDVLYTPLPIHHSVAGCLAVGAALIRGNTLVIRKRFSASQFWTDCADYNVTVAQYIGEICRYLLAQPPSKNETKHKLRCMVGNGLRPEIWTDFVTRFKIPNIAELYAATEGNCSFANFDNKVGAVGFIPLLAQLCNYPIKLIKIDEETNEPIRDAKTGMVINCKPHEPGEIVGRIDDHNAMRQFSGYADGNESSTESKIIRDVFRKGDKAFRSGDRLVMDEYGYFYFQDRMGDTFRWKGENCSSAEIEATIGRICKLSDVVVYGVSIPFTDGKAGMASIADPEGSLDFNYLASELQTSLPSYAIPIFIRIVKTIEVTGTFKLKKVQLRKEGISVSADPLYIYLNKQYVPFDSSLRERLTLGKFRL